ncbi:hypothetical protein [Arcanobacterium phocae]|uniref:hypothetical protein n=1 Tax=Arcanobacterium phocae TaxID=131112 RepID=UPI001C0EB5BA|nr:hypothetical protein [Arcanobacterium phocae]
MRGTCGIGYGAEETILPMVGEYNIMPKLILESEENIDRLYLRVRIPIVVKIAAAISRKAIAIAGKIPLLRNKPNNIVSELISSMETRKSSASFTLLTKWNIIKANNWDEPITAQYLRIVARVGGNKCWY